MGIRRVLSFVLCCTLTAGLVIVAAPGVSAAELYSIEQIIKPVGQQYYGGAVDISGNTAVVSHAPGSSEQPIFVYIRSGDTWAHQQTIDPPANAVRFGQAVAIDGDTIVVGAPNTDNGGIVENGSVFVYTRIGPTWSLQQELLLTNATADRFGTSVAIDGDTIVVGTPYADVPVAAPTIADAGTVSVFHRTLGVWTRTHVLTPADAEADDRLGTAVAVDAGVIAAGAPYHDVSGQTDQGGIYTWTGGGSTWTYDQMISTTTSGNYLYHGRDLALSGDTLVESAAGGPFAFVHSGAIWVSQGSLRPAVPVESWYGMHVDVVGNTAIVGADDQTVETDANRGAAFIFERSGSTWASTKTLTASDGMANENFGSDVAIGPTAALVGAWQARSAIGNAYFFSTPAPILTPVYRFYNARLGTHFYTADEAEKANVIATLAGTFAYEGPAYGVNPAAGTQSLWRFFNRRTGTHFYTASDTERNSVNANLGYLYTFEGPAYNVSASPLAGALTVYRFYNVQNGTHFYTANEAERDHVRNTLGAIYQYEGPAFWVGQ